LTEVEEPGFAFSFGTDLAVRKLTVQAMTPGGEILGFLKLPLNPQANERIVAEAAMLQKLAEFPQMRARVPRLYYAGTWGSENILFQSHLQGSTGPAVLGRWHEDFLADLHSCGKKEIPSHIVVEEVERAWREQLCALGRGWDELGRDILRVTAQNLVGKNLACAPTHGDFVPWNSRTHEGRLVCFDWESAKWEAPTQWDRFHFLCQSESLLHVGLGPNVLADAQNGGRSVYLLYLLYSSARLAAERSEPQTILYRERLIRRLLGGELPSHGHSAARREPTTQSACLDRQALPEQYGKI
jgi:hypothetical protein